MVDMETFDESIGTVVRLKRQVWSDSLQRHYMDTDLIIVIPTSHKEDFSADFEIYRRLDAAGQAKVLAHLRNNAYGARLLSQSDLPKAAPSDEPAQLSLM